MRWFVLFLMAVLAVMEVSCATTTTAPAATGNNTATMVAQKEYYDQLNQEVKWIMLVKFDNNFLVKQDKSGPTRIWIHIDDFKNGNRWEELPVGTHNNGMSVFPMKVDGVWSLIKEFRIPDAEDQPIILIAEGRNGCKYEVGATVECCNYAEVGFVMYRVSYLAHYKDLNQNCRK